jgi:dTDP-4-amino-4,6-dideoxygalactose transaminase
MAVSSQIPLFATTGVLGPLLDEIGDRQRDVLQSGRYILGPEVETFETEFAAYIGRRHCVGVANGTEALTIALRALGVGEGDEVVVPGVSFFATAEAVVNAGARPAFADLDPETHCMTAATVEPVLGPRTRALLPVHLFGNVVPMDELMDLAAVHGLYVLEDAAQAAGARLNGCRAGALGDAASFSFYPGKNLGAVGDAGAILTDDDDVAELARTLRAHGQGEQRWHHVEVGYNSRLDELQAAALRVLLPHLDGWTAARRAAAAAYERAGIGELVEPQSETAAAASAYHLYVVKTDDRDLLGARLAELGIETRAYYTTPLHRQPALLAHSKQGPALPASEALAAEGLALPMGPCLEDEDVERIVAAIRQAL